MIIQGGTVCDGAGSPLCRQDILLKSDRIVEIGIPGAFDHLEEERINASGKVIAPGFIDAHAHDELRKIRFPEMRTKLLQGVTTTVDGNCGNSPSCVPGELKGRRWSELKEYAALLAETPASVNTVALCGHNTLRSFVMGRNSALPTPAEQKRMRKLLEQSLEAGAAGWSSGLTYLPGKFSDTAELLALSKATKGSSKIYASHIRSEGDDLLHAAEEAITVARAGSGEAEISHLKTIFPRNFHKIDALLALLKNARESLTLHADRYPYIYSATIIRQILPPPYDKVTDIAEQLKNSASYRQEITEALKHSPRDLASTVLFTTGGTIAQLAAEKALSLEETGMLLLLEDPVQHAAYRCMSEENMLKILAEPWVCAGSDGISMQLDTPETGHPRAVGTFPRFFRIVSKLCGIPEAVRRMTSLPASVFHIPERGLIRKGFFADLVIFDPETYDSQAGFTGENQAPSGVSCVLVNGQTAWSSTTPEKVGCYGRFLALA